MNKKVVISGGPGAGKSSLLNALQTHGYQGVDEAARIIIKQEQEKNSTKVPWIDTHGFSKLVLKRMLLDLEKSPTGLCFFDRGLPDIIAHLELANTPIFKELIDYNYLETYHSKVFILPSWFEIYKQDNERKQDFKLAKAIGEAIFKVYKNLGFDVITVPKTTIEKRIQFILNELNLK